MDKEKRLLLQNVNKVLKEVIEDLDAEGELQLAEELFNVNFKITVLLNKKGDA